MHAVHAATIDVTSLPMRIEQGGYRVYILYGYYLWYRYGHIQGVGVTAYPYSVYTGEVEPNVTNNRK